MNAFEKAKAETKEAETMPPDALVNAVKREAEALRHMLTHTDVAQVTAEEIVFSWEEK